MAHSIFLLLFGWTGRVCSFCCPGGRVLNFSRRYSVGSKRKGQGKRKRRSSVSSANVQVKAHAYDFATTPAPAYTCVHSRHIARAIGLGAPETFRSPKHEADPKDIQAPLTRPPQTDLADNTLNPTCPEPQTQNTLIHPRVL